MDEFKRAKFKEISIGGIQCPCCSPIACKDKSHQKKALNRRARTRLKRVDREQAKSEMVS